MIHRLPISGLATALLAFTLGCGSDSASDNTNIDAAMVEPDPMADPTAFRITKMTLLDPYPFAANGLIEATQIVNDSIVESIEQDTSDPLDGVLDLNIALVFRPVDTTATATAMAITFPNCSSPLATTICTEDATTTVVDTTATNMSSDCLQEVPGTLTAEYDPVVPVPGPCFVSSPVDITVNLGSVTLPLKETQIAATYSGADPTTLTTGLLRGFVTESDADTILIPDDVALVGGDPLSSLLLKADMDMGAGGQMGWWFYLSLEAGVVEYVYAQ